MQKITPHLWFDTQAKEAAEFYTQVFVDSETRIISHSVLHDTPSGDCDVMTFELYGQKFMSISAGPYFKFNPSISFHVKCATKEEVDVLWNQLIDGGKALMELGSYPFSDRYGWLEDKYGLSWQIIFAGDKPITQKIVPAMLFVKEVCGRTEEAINFYTSVFKDSKIDFISRYGADQEPDKEGTVNYAEFILEGMKFGAMDSAHDHKFTFNEAISFIVSCDTQEEIDYYWGKLSTVPESEQCGWCKDQFGVSWQIVPSAMNDMLSTSDEEAKKRVTEAFLKMKKFDIAQLQKAFDGK